ncbi:hypothetical protein J6I39_08465 [bacterium]|nr:hypothetical protein [bacterium]
MQVTPIFQNSFVNYKQQQSYKNQALRLRQQPATDTVSFGARMPKYDNTFFKDALSRGYDNIEPELIAMAKEFHAGLRRAIDKVKAYGFEYDVEYNSKCPIKHKDSVMDKYERQGSAQDMIRGTIYWQDQQDVLAFKKFLEAMKEEGWILSRLRRKDPQTGSFIKGKNGQVMRFPDLEIRQNGITQASLEPLGEFIQRADISRPRESTYADWQMRFVSSDTKVKMEDRRECEVIFLYGKNYKDAKETEHKYVYEPIRELKKIHVDMDPEHHPKGAAGHAIASNAKEIQKRLVQFVSQPLFVNAFNADLKIKDAVKLPVEISKSYSQLITHYMNVIKKSIPVYYKEINTELLKDERIIESIKSSPSYQIRTDKAIDEKEIKDTKRAIKERIAGWKEDDSEMVKKVAEALKETLEKFVVKD